MISLLILFMITDQYFICMPLLTLFSVLIHAMYHFTIYKMFLHIPPEFYFLINHVKFRLLSVQRNLYRTFRLSNEYSVPHFFDLEWEQLILVNRFS